MTATHHQQLEIEDDASARAPMQACDDLDPVGHDVVQSRERLELMWANAGETADKQRDRVSLGSSGGVA